MADFKTHVTVSTALGIGYGAVAYAHFGVPAPSCVLAGTLCSVSGMLPDLDSDSGVPLRESLCFAAACVPMLLLDRFRHLGWSMETIALAGAGIYIAIRFGVGKLLKKYTVHRGMFHSIPAAAIAGEIAFLVCASGDIYLRAYKACAVMAGFLSHLILDEIWSVRFAGGRFELKSSSGTAMKFWGDSGWANISCYGKLILLGVVVLNDPIWSTVSPEGDELHTIASNIFSQVESRVPWQTAGNPQQQNGAVGGGPQSATSPSYGPSQPYGPPQPYASQQPYAVPYSNAAPYPSSGPNSAPYLNPNPYQYAPQQYQSPQYSPPPQPQPYYDPTQAVQPSAYDPNRRY